MDKLSFLRPGDCVEVIAPASRCSDEVLNNLINLLESWELHCIINEAIFAKDLLCANQDATRFELLKKALYSKETKAIICVRGGYGSMRLIPELSKLPIVTPPKLFIGMSDITALHLFLGQYWGWSTIHGALSRDIFSSESIAALQAILFGETKELILHGKALNAAAEKNTLIQAQITGGNLSLVQTSIGTLWQVDCRNKILLLEEIAERGYRVDRMLTHLVQAHIFEQAAAVILGDFLRGEEPNGSSLLQPVLERFAKTIPIPVIQMKGIGHGPTNWPLPFGIPAELFLGKEVHLRMALNFENLEEEVS